MAVEEQGTMGFLAVRDRLRRRRAMARGAAPRRVEGAGRLLAEARRTEPHAATAGRVRSAGLPAAEEEAPEACVG
jgi:hypothetical protein